MFNWTRIAKGLALSARQLIAWVEDDRLVIGSTDPSWTAERILDVMTDTSWPERKEGCSERAVEEVVAQAGDTVTIPEGWRVWKRADGGYDIFSQPRRGGYCLPLTARDTPVQLLRFLDDLFHVAKSDVVEEEEVEL